MYMANHSKCIKMYMAKGTNKICEYIFLLCKKQFLKSGMILWAK